MVDAAQIQPNSAILHKDILTLAYVLFTLDVCHKSQI